jgi:SNF2 family DNA or RNA helicase
MSYDWLGKKPWEIQKTTTALLTKSARAYVLNEFGTGKTRSVIWAADYLRRVLGLQGPVLVAAPLSTLSPVWESEIFKLDPRARVQILHGSKQERLNRLASEADWYIINHHGLPLILDALVAKPFSIFVIDELAVLRNSRTRLWRSAQKLIYSGSNLRYVWGLTGSPTPKAPTDAWAQIKLLTPGNTTRTFTRFRDLTMNQITQFRWVRKQGAKEIIHNQMQPSVRFALNDVTELPQTTYRRFDVPLEPLAAKAYKMMLDKLRIQTDNGESITAANEGILQSKLLQVACGFIYTDDKGVLQLPVGPRLDTLSAIVESTDRKFIVFVPFVHALEGVAAHLLAADEDIAVVHGGTPVGLRNKVFRAFQEGVSPRGIVAHPGCMAHGLTLTSANTIIWYSPTNSFETYEQANARIVRPGQTSKTLIAHLVGTSVERAVYQRLQDRKSFQGLLLDLFHQQDTT